MDPGHDPISEIGPTTIVSAGKPYHKVSRGASTIRERLGIDKTPGKIEPNTILDRMTTYEATRNHRQYDPQDHDCRATASRIIAVIRFCLIPDAAKKIAGFIAEGIYPDFAFAGFSYLRGQTVHDSAPVDPDPAILAAWVLALEQYLQGKPELSEIQEWVTAFKKLTREKIRQKARRMTPPKHWGVPNPSLEDSITPAELKIMTTV